MKHLILSILTVLIFSSCVQQEKTLYHWGSYESTLYNSKKEVSAKNDEAHKKALRKIFEKCDSGKMKVPPGLYSEYAYLVLREGNATEANEYFQKEANAFPESSTFIQFLTKYSGDQKSNEQAGESNE
jgi:hypothetical protein